VLKDLIPSIRIEVIAYIIEQYKNSEFVFNEGGEVRYNIQKIVTEDDIFDRIYTFS